MVIYEFFRKSAFGGSKGGIISSWLRELGTLIFVQTFQAFLLAVVMSIIVKAISGTYAKGMEGGLEAVGLLAIFALLSLPKLELLVKNIFGLTSGVADTSLAGGQKTLTAGKLFARDAARRLIDNPRKIGRGVKKLVGAYSIHKNYKNGLNESENSPEALEAAQNQENIKKNSAYYNKLAVTDYNKALGYDQNKVGAAIGDVSNGNGSGNVGARPGGSLGLDAGQFATLIGAITNTTNAVQSSGGSSTPKDTSKNSGESGAKEVATSGLKDIASGVFETIGAAHGAVGGAVIGAGLNQNPLDSAAIGAGIGDAIGQMSADVTSAIAKGLTNKSSNSNGKSVNKNTFNTTNNTTNSVKNTFNNKIENHSSSANAKDISKEMSSDLSKTIQKELDSLKKDVNEFKKTKSGNSDKNTDSKDISKQVSDAIKKNSNSTNKDKGKKVINVDDLD